MAFAPYLVPLLGAQHGQPKPPGPISEKRLYWDFIANLHLCVMS